MNQEKDNCEICNGEGKNMFAESCTFCNGTGEYNIAADKYMNNHICQCIYWDRKFCPICKNKCHHDSSQNQKQIIDSGHGGLGNVSSVVDTTDTTLQEEEIVA